MREIKFRAWIKPNYYTEGGYMLEWRKDIKGINLNGIIIPLTYTDESFKDCFDMYDNKDIILMQSTNLYDENENEIYTGDIVEVNNKLYKIQNYIGSMAFVRVSDDINMYREFINCWNNNVYPMSQYYWENSCEDNILSGCKVIGNIYNNKELLKDISN